MNDELMDILQQCNSHNITALRVDIIEREVVAEDNEGRLTTFTFDELS